jgi:hypothetical protein
MPSPCRSKRPSRAGSDALRARTAPDRKRGWSGRAYRPPATCPRGDGGARRVGVAAARQTKHHTGQHFCWPVCDRNSRAAGQDPRDAGCMGPADAGRRGLAASDAGWGRQQWRSGRDHASEGAARGAYAQPRWQRRGDVHAPARVSPWQAGLLGISAPCECWRRPAVHGAAAAVSHRESANDSLAEARQAVLEIGQEGVHRQDDAADAAAAPLLHRHQRILA